MPETQQDWRALGLAGARLLQEGKYADAIAAFEQLTTLRPEHADSWFNLGYARRQARDYEAALQAYGEALARNVARPEEVRLNRAAILSEYLGRTDEALAELRLAVEGNPRFAAGWINLGNLFEDLGRTDEAREAYAQALRAAPRNGRALARLAALDTHDGQPRRAITMLRSTASSAPQPTEDSAEVQFALANALDAAGDYGAAFVAAEQANTVAASLRPPAQRYDRSAQERLVDALVETFPAAKTPVGAEDCPVIFICGMFRSGSTLTEQVLGRHPQVEAGGELEFIPAMVREKLQPYPGSVAGLSADRIAELGEEYLAQVRKLFPDAPNVTDKRPDNFLHIGLIKSLFPKARIVHTVRQPLDNILSVYFLHFADSVNYSDRLDDIVHYYRQYRRLMDHWQSLYGDDMFTARYDELVADPNSVLDPLLSFLGLGWDDALLTGTASTRSVRTASNLQVRKPLHRRSSGRWRNYAAELRAVERRLEELGLAEAP